MPSLDGGQVGYQFLDLVTMGRLPRLLLSLRNLRDLHQQVHTYQKRVDVRRLKPDLAFLSRDQAIFHRVRHPHRRAQAHDPRRAFQRVRRAHQGLDHLGRRTSALQRHQALRQHSQPLFRLHVEQVHHRKTAQVVAHCPMLRKAAKTRCSSRKLTLRSSQETIA